ncbi:MAG TPA: hypothetical protein VF092_23355 [Longimicrobium sp.]
MADKIIAVSDLHMGRGNNQDDFRSPVDGNWRDGEWEAFCGSVVDASEGKRLTFVLNGDIIDLWEIAKDEELSGPGAAEEIRRNLCYPAESPEAEDRATAFGMWQIDACLGVHRGFVNGLRTLLSAPNVRIVYTIGNHDHAMANPRLQAHFRDHVDEAGPVGAHDPERLRFSFYHQDDELHAYVEHGNQFAGDDSAFRNPAKWTEEALGYYALRFTWNRYQAQHNVIAPSTAEQLSLVRAILSGQYTPQQLEVMQYLIDYFLAFEDGAVPKLAGGFGIGIVHARWRKEGKPKEASELMAKRAAADLKAAKQSETQAAGAAMGLLPGSPAEELTPDPFYDRYTEGLITRFNGASPPFPDLDAGSTNKLLLGHTHRPLNQWLYRETFTKQRYLNCGTWTRELKSPTFAYVVTPNWKDLSGLREFR